MPTALGTVASHRTGSRVPPIPTVGLAGWWDADDTSTFTFSSGNIISQWRDKSGNNRHYGQTSQFVEHYPTRSGTLNGRPVIVFPFNNGGQSHLVQASWAMTKPVNMFVVAKNVQSSGQRTIVSFPNDGRIFMTSSGTIDIYQGQFLSTGVPWGTTKAHLVSAVFNGASSKVAADGGAYVVGDAGGATFDTSVNAALGVFRGGGDNWTDGSIAELLLYDRELSPVERTEVEAYLRRKWIIDTNNPFTMVPWHAAYWASDPLWTPPADGAAVTTWRDGSGNSRDMTTTGAPLYRASSSVVNGKPAVDFNATGKGAITAAFTDVPQPLTMVGVYWTATAAGEWYAMGGHEQSTYGFSVGIKGGNWWMQSNNAYLGSPATAGLHLVMGRFNQSNSRITVDGVGGPLGFPNNIWSAATKWVIGSAYFHNFSASGQNTYAFVGFKAEALTVQEEADLLAWAQRTYGTPAPPAPHTVSGLAAWYDADDSSSISTLEGTTVTQWRDKTANGYHLLPRNDAYRPGRNGTSISGKTTVVYNDGHKLHSATGASAIGAASQAVTVISVFKTILPQVSYTTFPGDLSSGPNGAPLHAWDSNRYLGGAQPSSYLNNFGPFSSKSLQTWTVYAQTLYVDGLTPRLVEYINGTQAATGSWADGPLPTAGQVINIGSRDDNVTSFRGEVAEVLIYNRVLTTAERNKLVAYLDNKWNTWTPSAPIPSKSMIGWWDADDASTFTYASGSLVQTWADKSKAGHHLSSPSAGGEPSRTGTQNGHVSLDYTAGTKKVLENISLAEAVGREYAFTLFIAFKKKGASNTYEALPVNVNGDYWGNSYVAGGMPGIGGRGIIAATSWEVWTHVVSSPDRYRSSSNPAPLGIAEQFQYINGRLLVKYTPTWWDWGAGTPAIVSGSRSDRSTQFSGEVGEILLYNRKLPEAERKQVEAYLMAKWAPGIPTDGLLGWWDAADTTTITASAGVVSQWRDKSGNGRYAEVFPGHTGPTTGAATVNGKNVITLAPTKTLRTAYRVNGYSGPVTICAVGRATAVTYVRVMTGIGPEGVGAVVGTPANWSYMVSPDHAFGTIPADANAHVVVGELLREAGTNTMWVDGAFGGSRASPAFTLNDLPIVFGHDYYYWDGDIAESIIYTRALSTEERRQVEVYLARKWLVPADNNTFNPLSIPWHSAWWASDPGWTPPADGAGVASWRNAGTDAKNATNSVPSGQPTYRAADANLNNRPSLNFSGANWMNVASPTIAQQPNHFFIVACLQPGYTGTLTLTDGSGGRNLIRNTGTGGRWQMYSGGSIYVGAGMNGPFMAAALFDGTSSHVRENGTNSESGNTGTGGFSNLIIGADAGGGASGAFVGSIAFFGVKSGAALTSLELANLEAWASSYYGVAP